MERRFALVGHRAPSSGKINLNDLAGSCGRLDVLLRAVNSALFLSHGIRQDSHVTLHLMGGPGLPRRICFQGSTVKNLHPDERALAGQIAKVLKEPVPAIGIMSQVSPGITHSGGDISTTLEEWSNEGVTQFVLSADAEISFEEVAKAPPEKIGLYLSDDMPFSDEEECILASRCESRTLGSVWLQGHMAIGVVHHLLDSSNQD